MRPITKKIRYESRYLRKINQKLRFGEFSGTRLEEDGSERKTRIENIEMHCIYDTRGEKNERIGYSGVEAKKKNERKRGKKQIFATM